MHTLSGRNSHRFLSLLMILLLYVVLALAAPLASEAQVVYVQQNCTVTWSPGSETDLAGYRVWAVRNSVSGPIVTVPVGPAPQATCTQLGVLLDGVHTINLIAFDTANNASAPPVVKDFVRDTVAPNTLVTPTITGANASFSLSSTEAGSTFDCKLDAGAWAPCVSPKVYTALSEGAHTFDARATDQARNTDTTVATHTWSVNTSAPGQPSGLTITPNFP